MTDAVTAKGGGTFEGVRLLLCENPLPPLEQAVEAARAELARSNLYTEPYSQPLREVLADQAGVDVDLIHVNAGSELILRQLFDRFGQQVHLLTPTYPLFPQIARCYTETRLLPHNDFGFDLGDLDIPTGTTLAVIVNPNNPNGGTFDPAPLRGLLRTRPETIFLVDEAFIGMGGESVVSWVPDEHNLVVTRTLSKAHSLAGFRVGYAVAPRTVADDLNHSNDAYPLTRASQAAAIATLHHERHVTRRATRLRDWSEDLRASLESLGIRTFPTSTYFFLADFAPHDATLISDQLEQRGILTRPLDDPHLPGGYMRFTTALPEQNAVVVDTLGEVLARAASVTSRSPRSSAPQSQGRLDRGSLPDQQDTQVGTIAALRRAGFTEDFYVDHPGISATGHDPRRAPPEDFSVIATYRFEGISDPDDEAIILALVHQPTGLAGTLDAAFGPEASADEAAVLTHLPRPLHS